MVLTSLVLGSRDSHIKGRYSIGTSREAKLGGCFGQSLGWAPFFFGGADLIVLDLLSIRWLKKIFSPNGSINGDTMGESNKHL